MSGTPQLYIPFLVDIGDAVDLFKDDMPYVDQVDFNVVFKQLLDEIFYDRTPKFGRWIGSMGAYLSQVPYEMINADLETYADVKCLEYQSVLADFLSSAIPSLTTNTKDFIYYYPPGERNLFVYVPFTPDLPAEYASKAVPREAVHYSIR